MIDDEILSIKSRNEKFESCSFFCHCLIGKIYTVNFLIQLQIFDFELNLLQSNESARPAALNVLLREVPVGVMDQWVCGVLL